MLPDLFPLTERVLLSSAADVKTTFNPSPKRIKHSEASDSELRVWPQETDLYRESKVARNMI